MMKPIFRYHINPKTIDIYRFKRFNNNLLKILWFTILGISKVLPLIIIHEIISLGSQTGSHFSGFVTQT